MKPVICFGEALIDFLNTSEQTDGPLTLKNYRQYPGGAPANAAVAVAKLGGNALFAGQVGNDTSGLFLEDALKTYGVDTRFLCKHPTAKTALAFVTLDAKGERSFSFYRHETADILFHESQVSNAWFTEHPIIHFCSNTLTQSTIANCTEFVVDRARDNDSIISFDVNLRHNLWPEQKADRDLVNQLAVKSDIIKMSREEFEYLSQGDETAYIEHLMQENIILLLITDGPNDIQYITAKHKEWLSVPTVNAIDTTGGGDAFIGAFLFILSQFPEPYHILSDTQKLSSMIQFSIQCGAHAVTKPGAFPSFPLFDDISQYWPQEITNTLFQKNIIRNKL